MKTLLPQNVIATAAIVLAAVGTTWTVRHFHKPGQLDVLTAQAMDMSQMRPPVGAAPVALALVRRGSLANTVTYSGTVAAYNEQEISARITGTLVALPVYPGDAVRAGQVLAQLDTAELGAKADQARQEARQAQIGAQVAHLTHDLHHQAALDQASAQAEAARLSVLDAQAEAQASQGAVSDAQAGVQAAQANASYWKTEIVRERALADAGAVSRQEYQNELAQAQSAQAAVVQAQAKASQARAMAVAARAKIQVAGRQAIAAQAGVRMAQADAAVARGQALQAEAGADASASAARAASVQQGYSRIVSPFDGVVTARPASPGTLVQPGMLLLKVAQIDRVRVQANVAVEDMAGIHVGSKAAITVQGSGKTLKASITAIFPSASAESRTAVVEAVVPNTGHRLLPGAFVTMQIASAAAADKLLVPASAILTQGGQSSVWIALGGEAEAQEVQVYECAVCHMRYSAAQAKKLGYHDPMDGGRLTPVPGAQGAALAQGLTAHQVLVHDGASDGAWTEVSSQDLHAQAQVVAQGQAGLTEGARIVATPWGTDGPKALPTASASLAGQTVYRCEKCGMTYSAADAKKHHYVDPMDGGRLVPVTPAPSAKTSMDSRMPGMKM